MKTKKDLEKRLVEINQEISNRNQEISKLREEGLKIIGQIELLTEQEKEAPKE